MTAAADPEPIARPLRPEDPPRVDGFWLDARLVAGPAGVAYAARSADAPGVPTIDTPTADTPTIDTPAVEERGTGPLAEPDAVLVLLSRGAAADRVARDRFTGRVDRLHVDLVLARGGWGQDTGRLSSRHRAMQSPVANAEPDAPWVALTADQLPLATSILADVALVLPSAGPPPAGPDYRLPWADDTAPGRTSVWPLPWPGRFDRAGWLSLFVSWLLMILVAAVAVLVAILLFRHEPPQTPPPPQPQSASPSPSSASPTPTPSPSPRSASPSPSSASPSPVSPSPSPTASGSGIPERSRL